MAQTTTMTCNRISNLVLGSLGAFLPPWTPEGEIHLNIAASCCPRGGIRTLAPCAASKCFKNCTIASWAQLKIAFKCSWAGAAVCTVFVLVNFFTGRLSSWSADNHLTNLYKKLINNKKRVLRMVVGILVETQQFVNKSCQITFLISLTTDSEGSPGSQSGPRECRWRRRRRYNQRQTRRSCWSTQGPWLRPRTGPSSGSASKSNSGSRGGEDQPSQLRRDRSFGGQFWGQSFGHRHIPLKVGNMNLNSILGSWHKCTDRSKLNVEIKMMIPYHSVQNAKFNFDVFVMQCLLSIDTSKSNSKLGTFSDKCSRRVF